MQEAPRISKWKAVAQEEMKALYKNESQELTKLSLGKKTVGCN